MSEHSAHAAAGTDLAEHLLDDRPARPASTAVKVTVNLSERSKAALNELTQLTDDTKTEVINKALQVYQLIQLAQSQGGGVWIREAKDGDLTRVRFV